LKHDGLRHFFIADTFSTHEKSIFEPTFFGPYMYQKHFIQEVGWKHPKYYI